MNEQELDKCRGCLYGLAIGDALGAAVEFKAPGTFPPVLGYRGGGPHNIAGGQWTDDTSMALALADSIGQGWNLNDQIERYILWWQEGKYAVNGWCFDIGGTTKTALWRYMETKDVWGADSAAETSGNGSIMRLAPVAIKYHKLFPDKSTELMTKADGSSLTTHASDQCLSACRYLSMVLSAMIRGVDREEILPALGQWTEIDAMNLCPEIAAVAAGSYRTKEPIVGSGWVVESLEAALWAFSTSHSFKEAVLKAVNLGNDSDTTGAVCGQLAGAYWGKSGIPDHLLAGLDRKDMIEKALDSLLLAPAPEALLAELTEGVHPDWQNDRSQE